MRRSLWLILGFVLLISGLVFVSGCPKTETDEGTGIERPGGEQVQPGTPARPSGVGTEGAPAEAPGEETAEEEQAPAGEEGATAPGAEGAGDEETGEEEAEDTGDDSESASDEDAQAGT